MSWAADIGCQPNLQNLLTHPRQDSQPGYQAILGHEASRKLAEAAAQPIETDINGKEKYRIAADAFTRKYITTPKKLGYAIVSLIDHAITVPMKEKPSIRPSRKT